MIEEGSRRRVVTDEVDKILIYPFFRPMKRICLLHHREARFCLGLLLCEEQKLRHLIVQGAIVCANLGYRLSLLLRDCLMWEKGISRISPIHVADGTIEGTVDEKKVFFIWHLTPRANNQYRKWLYLYNRFTDFRFFFSPDHTVLRLDKMLHMMNIFL